MPDWKSELKARLAASNLPPEREIEIIEELSQHLEEEYESALERGLTETEARAAVLAGLDEQGSLGDGLGRQSQSHRGRAVPGAGSTANLFGDLAQDLRYALRMLWSNPGFTAVALIALALGIGANTAIFSVVNTVLLRPLPFKDQSQLVMLWDNAAHLGFPKDTPSPANFLDWRRRNTVFQGVSAIAWRSYNLTGTGEPERLDGQRASANLFELLGVRPILGRGLLPEDDKPGTRIVVLSEGLWQRRFGADPGVVGRAIMLNGESYTVVGVMPATVRVAEMTGRSNQLWVPLAFPNEEAALRSSHYLKVIARLKAGVTLDQARAEMSAIAARLAQEYPDDNKGIGIVVNPLVHELVGDIKPALLLLLGAVGFVLLIACANVANLLLARAAVRQKEIALRLALGASRARLARQFITESVVLALLGGGLGLFLAYVGVDLLKSLVPPGVWQASEIGIDGRVLLFTVGVALVTGVIFGLAPAAQLSRLDLNDTLKDAGRDSSSGGKGHRLRNALVVGEVAVSFLLLIGAGLLISSFVHLRNLDPGFDAHDLLTMKIELSETKYPDTRRRVTFFDEVVRRVETLPGVKSVAIAGNLPLTYDGDSTYIGVEGVPDPPPEQRRDVIYRAIGPGYFKTMGIPLVRGRDFTAADTLDKTLTTIISEMTAEYYWPGQDPLGKRIKGGGTNSDGPWREVIGVVKDVRQNNFIAEPKMEMYFSYRQLRDLAPNALIIRTSVPPLSLAAPVRDAVWAVDKDQTVADIDTMEHIVAEAVARQRFSMLLLGIFAGVALLLAAVGIYGVMSYSVAQRTREIGIRIALGARRSDVLRMTILQGLRLVALGLALGLVAAFVVTPVIQSLLYGVSPTDPLTFISISFVLLAVALIASYLPALRATKVDPMIALRAQ